MRELTPTRRLLHGTVACLCLLGVAGCGSTGPSATERAHDAVQAAVQREVHVTPNHDLLTVEVKCPMTSRCKAKLGIKNVPFGSITSERWDASGRSPRHIGPASIRLFALRDRDMDCVGRAADTSDLAALEPCAQ